MSEMDKEVMFDLAMEYLHKAQFTINKEEKLEGLKKGTSILNNLLKELEGDFEEKSK